MKALILAAGLGTRLRPLTDTIPKALVPIAGKPLLAYHLDTLRKHGIEEVIVDVGYLADKVQDFVEQYSAQYAGLRVVLSHDPDLVGSAGVVQMNRDRLQGEDFIVIYADNFTNIDYTKLLSAHRQRGAVCTIACYYESHPESKGILVYDDNMRIQQFIEKPQPHEVVSNFANAGVYVCSPELFEHIDKAFGEPYDFSRHLFPYLLKETVPLHAHEVTEYFIDIGTPETYQKAQEDALTIVW